jgi:hypothetical protein
MTDVIMRMVSMDEEREPYFCPDTTAFPSGIPPMTPGTVFCGRPDDSPIHWNGILNARGGGPLRKKPGS